MILGEDDVKYLYDVAKIIATSNQVGFSYKKVVSEILKFYEEHGRLSRKQWDFVVKNYNRTLRSTTRGRYSEMTYMDGLDRDELADWFGIYQY